MVSNLSIGIIIVNMILGILIPMLLLIFFKKKFGAGLKSFWIGCAVMLLFALVLEQLVHLVVFQSPLGNTIMGNIWLYALYGSLMAGLFEETGRFLAMRFVLKKEHDNAGNALMYGAGHGGFEMFVILSIGMINNLIYSLMINLGQTEVLLNPLDDASRSALQAGFDALLQTPSWQFLLSPIERIGAIGGQIGLSVIVWFAATGKKVKIPYFILAILLHALLDAIAVIAAKLGLHLMLVEAIIYLMVIGILLIAKAVWKKERTMA